MAKQKVSVKDFAAVISAACAQYGKSSVDFRQLQYGYLSNTKQRKKPRKDTRPQLKIVTIQKKKTTTEFVPVVAKYFGDSVLTHTGDVFTPKKGMSVVVEIVNNNSVEI